MADYGTNGDSALSRPDATPSRSDTVLVTTPEYNSAGEALKTIDAKGKEDRSTFDHAGRRVMLVEAYDDGDYSTGAADRDRTSEWAYTADGQIAAMTARNPNTGGHLAKYVYGSTYAVYRYPGRDTIVRTAARKLVSCLRSFLTTIMPSRTRMPL